MVEYTTADGRLQINFAAAQCISGDGQFLLEGRGDEVLSARRQTATAGVSTMAIRTSGKRT
jgi:hypothetical protein